MRLAHSYIYCIEEEKLSEKEAFLKGLQLRYQLKKTGEIADDLEKQGLIEEEIKKKAYELMRFNSIH